MLITDAWLSFLQALIAVLFGLFGVVLTMRAANTLRQKAFYWAVFGVLSLASLWIVYAQGRRGEAAQARNEAIQQQNQREIARLQEMIAKEGGDISGAIRGLRAEPPSAADKATRKALRRTLTNFLARGDEHRRAISASLDSPIDKGIREAVAAVDKWDRQLIEYIRINMGDERATWMRARIPPGTYPAGSYYLEVQQAWDTVASDMAKIEQLLRDHPEL
jgi:cbb3-type cytochrome oxidase subunit 3